MSNLLTVREIVNLYPGIDRTDVVYAIKSKKLKAEKVGWVWVVKRENLPQKWQDLGIKSRRGASR